MYEQIHHEQISGCGCLDVPPCATVYGGIHETSAELQSLAILEVGFPSALGADHAPADCRGIQASLVPSMRPATKDCWRPNGYVRLAQDDRETKNLSACTVRLAIAHLELLQRRLWRLTFVLHAVVLFKMASILAGPYRQSDSTTSAASG